MQESKRHFISASLLAAALVLVPGCTARLMAGTPTVIDGYGAVYTDDVPADLSIYPRVFYRGSYAYYVQGQWYRRAPDGWVIYRETPPELNRYRPFVQQAPPAPRYYGPTSPPQAPSPAQPYPNPSPPPAIQVR